MKQYVHPNIESLEPQSHNRTNRKRHSYGKQYTFWFEKVIIFFILSLGFLG